LRSPSISSIVAVGRLIPSKNFETVIRAISDLDVTLTIIGDGELKETLSLIARECGVQDRVHFVGMIPRIEVYQYLMQSSTFVSASMVEGLPKAVLEAMACGCLPVLSDIPAHREISDNIDTPVPMVPPTDHRGFAAAIRTIVQMPAIQRQELSRIYMRLVEEKYSLSRMLAEYRAVYTELLENRSALRKLDMP
jgi:teichuronic acid biosynthesis glycosyltransferase TuaC